PRPRRTLPEAYCQAGGGALYALEVLNAFGNGPAELVEVVCLHLDDNVVGAGDRVDRRDFGVGVLQRQDCLADTLRVADFGLDQYVSADSHGPDLLRSNEPEVG